MTEPRELHVAALGDEIDGSSLQRVPLRRGVLGPTGELSAPGRAGGRPAMLYRFASTELGVGRPSS